ncbi:MAG: FG-GAP repeat protein, partial [Proteobacteria bacterium]|nr:FG-GAP repeat protein [Pseudomonadota bacterium]
DYYGQGLVTVKAGGTIPDAHNGLASFASTRLWGAPDSFLGASISAGDINGDGVDDFVAGAPGLGQAQVVLSDGDALPTGDVTASATVDSGYDAIPVEPFFLPGTVTPNPQRVYPEEAFDAAHAVALFDADGDGYDDLAVLAHDAVYVFLSRF